MLVLLAIAVMALGFTVRANPLLVVLAAALTAGLAAAWTPGVTPGALIAALVGTVGAFGKAFNATRYVSVVWLVLPAIGLLERGGLQERAAKLAAGIRAATAGRVLIIYFALRQGLSALGLTSLGGQAQMVRPLIAPMAEAAAEARFGALPDKQRYLIRAHAAAADNIALFFGEDIFIAIGSILLIKAFADQNRISLEPLQLSAFAVPSALAALFIHAARLALLDRTIARTLEAPATPNSADGV